MSDVNITMEMQGLAGVTKGFNAVAAGAKTMGDEVDKTGAKTATLGQKMSGLKTTLAAIGAGAVIKYFVDLEDGMEQAARSASRLGVSFEGLQKLTLTAKRFGAETGAMDQALKHFNAQVGEASMNPMNTSARLFKQLGISITDTKGEVKDTETLFRETVNALTTVGSKAERTRGQFALFGDQSGQLTDMLSGGTAQLDKFGKQLESSGAILANEFSPMLKDANSNVYDLIDAVEGYAKKAVANIMVVADAASGVMMGSLGDIAGTNKGAAKAPDPDELLAGFQQDFMTKKSLKSALDPNEIANAKKYSEAIKVLSANYHALTLDTMQYDHEMAISTALIHAGVTAQSAHGQKIIELVNGIEQLTRSHAAEAAAFAAEADRTNNYLAARHQLVEDNKTAQERFNDEIERMAGLDLDAETLSRATEKLAQSLADTDPLAKSLGDSLDSMFDKAIDGGMKLKDILKSVGKDLLKSGGHSLLDGLGKGITRGASGMGDIITGGKSGKDAGDKELKTVFDGFIHGMKKLFGGEDGGFLGGLQKLFTDGDDSVLGGLGKIFDESWTWLSGIFTSFISESWAIAIWETAENWAIVIWDTIQKWAIAIFQAAMSLFGLERGGEMTVTRPTLLVVGEKNKAERVRVSPLSGGSRNSTSPGGDGSPVSGGGAGGDMGGGGNTSVNVFIPTTSVVNNLNAGGFAREIARTVRRENARLV